MSSTESSFELVIKLSTGVKFTLAMSQPRSLSELTIANVKECIQQQHPETTISGQKLIYKGRILENDKTLQDYGILAQSTLFLVVSNAGQIPRLDPHRNDIATEAKTSMNTSTTTTQGPSPPPDTLASLMQDMLGGGADGSDRTANTNPQLQQLLNDPGAMQQAMELMRNPGALQQAMRQQDLAMSQLENIPGGFNALRSMYHSMHSLEEDLMPQPLATPSTRNPPRNGDSNGLAGATGTAMPNPWSSGTTNTSGRSNTGSASARATPGPNPFHPGGQLTRPAGNPFLQAMMNGTDSLTASDTATPGLVLPLLGDRSLSSASAPPSSSSTGREQQGQLPSPLNNNPLASSPLIDQMMQQFAQGNPDMVREILQQHDPLLGHFFNSMSREQSNELIQNIIASPPPDEAGLGGMGSDMNDLIQQFLQNQQAATGSQPQHPLFPSSMTPPSFAASVQANPWATSSVDASSIEPPMDGVTLLESASAGQAVQSSATPQVRFHRQVQMLRDMGFDQEDRSIQALQAVGGNVNRAVDWLLSHSIEALPLAANIDSDEHQAAAEEDDAGAGAGADASNSDDTASS